MENDNTKIEWDIKCTLTPENELKIREACEEFEGEFVGKIYRPLMRFVIRASSTNIEKIKEKTSFSCFNSSLRNIDIILNEARRN